ncbi:MAG: glycoside hydrolase family 13 protein [Eubacteriales bacterium]|nr:glycoside hydrolase family 13 protein [Eubacteriales bacterium]
MQIYHNSRDSYCRSPFGAAAENSYVDLSLFLDSEELPERVYLDYVYGLREFMGGASRLKPSSEKKSIPRCPQGAYEYHMKLRVPASRGLLYYSFRLCMRSGEVLYVLNSPGYSGEAYISKQAPFYEQRDEERKPFQITLYDPESKSPDSFKGKILYQIFPDRFARDADWEKRLEALGADPERIIHRDFSEPVDFRGLGGRGYLALDFFGGSLEGIRESLDYFQELGVSVLYLNPIFKARSNHRYDAADYMVVDQLLGNNQSFQRLCADAAVRNISIILDIAMSHTGADSIYFNKYGRFETTGAYQDAMGEGISDYFSWYSFENLGRNDLSYDCWWGFPELPSVNENDLNYREYMLGDLGVLRHWLRLGASGFRLDVSDELPDDFIRDLRSAVKEENPEALILGEVWEDASNKISYGHYRDFIGGRTHDSVMGYPFRDALLRFFRNEIAANELHDRLESIRENYPPEFFAVSMNLLSSHDTARFATAVAGDPDPGDRARQSVLRLSFKQRQQARTRFILAAALQLAYPGMPAIYYGDELLMEGYGDPFNRQTFPADQINPGDPMQSAIREMAALRMANTILQTGYYQGLYAAGDCYVFQRFSKAGEDQFGRRIRGASYALCVINRGESEFSYEYHGSCHRVPGQSALWVLDQEIHRF